MTMALNRISVRCARRLNPSRAERVVDIIDLYYDYSQLFTTIRAQLRYINQRTDCPSTLPYIRYRIPSRLANNCFLILVNDMQSLPPPFPLQSSSTQYICKWLVIFFSWRIFGERSSFVFHSLFRRRIICLPTIDVELSLMNVDTSTHVAYLTDAAGRLASVILRAGEECNERRNRKKWSIATVDWKLRWNSEWIAHAIILDVTCVKKGNKSIPWPG